MKVIHGSGLVCLALVFSCTAAGEDDDGTGSNNNGNGNGSSSGGSGADSGSGGDDFGIGGSGGEVETEACQAIAQEATPALQAADIIFAIDTSGSMGDESSFVNANMNAFSQQIINSGIDVHVVMLAENQVSFPVPLPVEPPGICIAAPLGSGNCPDDTNLDQYFHSPGAEVGSTDGLNVILDSYNDWAFMMRPNATKTLVVITDDNHSQAPYNDANDIAGDADQFIADFTALDPALFDTWKMSGIYSFTNCPDAAQPGALWKEIIDKTGGLQGDLCQQQFQPIFDDLAAEIIVGASQLDCQWDIPAPPEGETLDPSLVNVVYTDGNGAEQAYGKVASEADCDPTQGGWYYDDNAAPSSIHLCQTSCDQAQADTSGKIDILFGCATEILVAD